MSIDLTVDSALSTSPQAIGDQDGNSSQLYVGTDSTAIPQSSKFVFGATSKGGQGEWHQNSNPLGTYGISTFVNSKEQVRVTDGTLSFFNIVAGSGTDLVIDSNGKVGKQSSSMRYKENIAPFEGDFEKVLALQPMSFAYKGTGQKTFGYLAEDVDRLGLKDLVDYDAEGRPDAVHYKQLGISAIELLKGQKAKMEAQDAKIAKMEAALERLEG